jgi:purine-binding chemotaxis protein CheW
MVMERKINTSKENQTSVIDWENIHSRMETFRERFEKGWHVTEQEKEQILMARTRSLARELNDETLSQEFLEVAEFMLADERYGVEMKLISEVYALKDLTPLPCTPPFILGVVNVRGKVLTVIDIKKLFELPDKGLNDLNKVIIVHAHGMEAGILADVIVGVRSVPVSNIQPELPTITGIRAGYMKGVTGDRLIILNMENIFSDERMIVNEGV